MYSRGALCPWLQGCSRFDARAGVYACSVDGNYVVRVSSGEAASDDSFLVLERSHVRGGRTCSHVAGAGSGSLMHLRAGDAILLRLVGTAPLPARPLAGPVRLAISLAMRMRCREPEGLLDEGDKLLIFKIRPCSVRLGRRLISVRCHASGLLLHPLR